MTKSDARIVVLNDDPVQLRFAEAILAAGGHRVECFLDPEEALSTLGLGEAPDLVVVDLHMPKIDGWRVCRLLRSPEYGHLNDIPVLVVSATFSGSDVESISQGLGADGFLAVPYKPEDLLDCVRRLLDGEAPRMRRSVLLVGREGRPSARLVEVFTRNGFDVHMAGPHGALERFDALGPQVVVLDYPLPDGAADRLLRRVNRPASPTAAIAVLEKDDPELPLRVLRAGADASVRRPFRSEHLLDLVEKALRERALLRIEEILESRTQELKRSEWRYRSLFETIPEPVVMTDREGWILRLNQAAREVLGDGERRPDLTGTRVLDLIRSEDHFSVLRKVTRVWRRGEGTFEIALHRPQGEPREFEVTARVVDLRGEPVLLTVSRDVTERRRAALLEERVRKTQKLESLGVLAGGIAHDFNNLLVGILGNANLARMDLEDDTGEIVESLEQIETAARRAAELTSQILSYAGRGGGAAKSLDLSGTIREMVSLLEPAISKKARLLIEPEEGLPLVLGDPGQIRQVVMNLIMNASDALEDRPGTIRVRTARCHLTREKLREGYLWSDLEEGVYVLLQVADDGCGMDPATQERIFDPFFTTKPDGRGLGLAATLGVVKACGATLFLESEEGRGSDFRIYFPALEETAQHPPDVDEAVPVRGDEEGTVMVVDDEPAVRRVASALLERCGYRVVQADDGERALELFHRNGAEIDALLLDHQMPKMDGLETLRALRELDGGVSVVISSGNVPSSAEEEMETLGVYGMIGKPYTVSELRSIMAEAVAAGRKRSVDPGSRRVPAGWSGVGAGPAASLAQRRTSVRRAPW